MCLYPRLIKNKKYEPNKKNGGHVPPLIDERTLYVPIGCQNCIECDKQKRTNWRTRLLEEVKHNTQKGYFITLTFSDENYKKLYEKVKEELQQRIKNATENKEIEKLKKKATGYSLDNAIAAKAIRKFLNRWRKKYKRSVRHWLITEIGHKGTENIHLHGIIWTDHEKIKTLAAIWKYGYVWDGNNKNEKKENYVNAKTVNYITKYITKKDEKHKTYKPIILTSAGIGSGYINTLNAQANKYKPNQTNEQYITPTGTKLNLPIYYRNKIYSEEEREKLWIEKLNKQKRYVLGAEIDVSEGEEEYIKAIEHARQKNIEMGYLTEVQQWNREQYEQQTRKINQLTRLQNAQDKAR